MRFHFILLLLIISSHNVSGLQQVEDSITKTIIEPYGNRMEYDFTIDQSETKFKINSLEIILSNSTYDWWMYYRIVYNDIELTTGNYEEYDIEKEELILGKSGKYTIMFEFDIYTDSGSLSEPIELTIEFNFTLEPLNKFILYILNMIPFLILGLIYRNAKKKASLFN